jgi:dolichol kinase
VDSLEVRRQLIHGSGIFIALLIKEAYSFFGGWLYPTAILAVAISIGYAISYLHTKGANLPILTKIINESERERDQDFPGRGALRFFIGALLTLLIFRNTPEIVAAGIIVLALGDSASTLGGVAYGRHKIPYNREKSIEGSVSGFGVAFIGLLILAPFSIVISACASLIGMAVESLPLGVDDNLTVPITASFSIWILTVAITI